MARHMATTRPTQPSPAQVAQPARPAQVAQPAPPARPAETSVLAAPAQGSLFAGGPVAVRPEPSFERTDLGGGAWVDVARDWLGGTNDLCMRLIDGVDWRHHRRWMYDRKVDEPRLSRWYRAGDALPDEALAWFRVAVGRHYHVRFGAVGLNYYRDGNDSVAFHADKELRLLTDTLVAIVTFGAARPFLLRPQSGGRSIDVRPASGDLLVMGGACQASWEHGVPKVAGGSGPRISASIRWVRGAGGAEREWAPPDRQAR